MSKIGSLHDQVDYEYELEQSMARGGQIGAGHSTSYCREQSTMAASNEMGSFNVHLMQTQTKNESSKVKDLKNDDIIHHTLNN